MSGSVVSIIEIAVIGFAVVTGLLLAFTTLVVSNCSICNINTMRRYRQRIKYKLPLASSGIALSATALGMATLQWATMGLILWSAVLAVAVAFD